MQQSCQNKDLQPFIVLKSLYTSDGRLEDFFCLKLLSGCVKLAIHPDLATLEPTVLCGVVYFSIGR
jgi:hypothetical protein